MCGLDLHWSLVAEPSQAVIGKDLLEDGVVVAAVNIRPVCSRY